MIRGAPWAIALIACHAHAQTGLRAPNVVPVSPGIVTSGQPDAASLARLAQEGFGAVIYLAPPTVPDAVRGEESIVRGQGLEFVNIPVDFDKPTQADFDAFAAAMDRFADRKVLVHCQVNMRASTFTFLYRAIVRREAPETAYEAVSRVWVPRGVWRTFAREQLRRANIAFEPN